MTSFLDDISARCSMPLRIGVLAGLLLVELVILSRASDAAQALDNLVVALFFASPLLVWFTVEPTPAPQRTPKAAGGRSLLLRFGFLAGGAGGVVFFLLTFLCAIGMYVLWLRFVSPRATWFGDDDPVQLVMGGLYACVYVLLPVGLCTPLLRWHWGRFAAAALCLGSYFFWDAAFPRGPRNPDTLTEFGNPGRMITTVLGDGELIHYAHDDLAVLAGLALLGVLLNLPRVVLRWRALEAAGARTQP